MMRMRGEASQLVTSNPTSSQACGCLSVFVCLLRVTALSLLPFPSCPLVSRRGERGCGRRLERREGNGRECVVHVCNVYEGREREKRRMI